LRVQCSHIGRRHFRPDFLLKMDARLDFEKGKFCLKRADKVGHDHRKREHCESQGTAARAARTVFSHKDGRRNQRSCWIGHRTRDERQCKQSEKLNLKLS